MRRRNAQNFFEKERDALVVATASDADLLELCRELGDDPTEVADQVRKLLLSAVSSTPSEVLLPDLAEAPLPFPYPELLPLHRILLVDDDHIRLSKRLEEFRRHQFKLGFAIETATNGQDALTKLENDRFDAVFLELSSPTKGTGWIIDRLRRWSTPLPPLLLNSAGMDVFELRRLNRNAIRALARGLGKSLPQPYRMGPKKPSQRELFSPLDRKKTGTS